jgi:hypothetical protein
MDMPTILFGLLVLGIIAIWYFKFRDTATNAVDNKKAEIEDIVPRKIAERKNITLEESLSFIDDIVAAVDKRFSQTDKILVINIGQILLKCGVGYQHVIEFAVRTMGRRQIQGTQTNISSTNNTKQGGYEK